MSPWPPILHSHPRRDALGAAANVLRNTFGHVDFRGVQPGVIGEILGGRSALAALPTGGGKSLCYQISTLVPSGFGLVGSRLSLRKTVSFALRLAATTQSPGSAPFRGPTRSAGWYSSPVVPAQDLCQVRPPVLEPWHSSNRRLWSNGIAKAFRSTDVGDHSVPDAARRPGRLWPCLLTS